MFELLGKTVRATVNGVEVLCDTAIDMTVSTAKTISEIPSDIAKGYSEGFTSDDNTEESVDTEKSTSTGEKNTPSLFDGK